MDKHECQVQQKVLSTLCEFCDVNELQDILERFSEFYKDKVREKDSNDGKILRKLFLIQTKHVENLPKKKRKSSTKKKQCRN